MKTPRATSRVITCTCHIAILLNLFPHHPYRMVQNRGEREAGVHVLVGCSVLSLPTVDGLSPCVNSSSPERPPRPLIKIYSVHTCLMGTSTNPALYGVLDSQWRTGAAVSVALGTKRDDSKSAGGWQGIRPGGPWMRKPCGRLSAILIASKYSWGCFLKRQVGIAQPNMGISSHCRKVCI